MDNKQQLKRLFEAVREVNEAKITPIEMCKLYKEYMGDSFYDIGSAYDEDYESFWGFDNGKFYWEYTDVQEGTTEHRDFDEFWENFGEEIEDWYKNEYPKVKEQSKVDETEEIFRQTNDVISELYNEAKSVCQSFPTLTALRETSKNYHRDTGDLYFRVEDGNGWHGKIALSSRFAIAKDYKECNISNTDGDKEYWIIDNINEFFPTGRQKTFGIEIDFRHKVKFDSVKKTCKITGLTVDEAIELLGNDPRDSGYTIE